MYINTCMSVDWFKGAVKRNPHVYWEKTMISGRFCEPWPSQLSAGTTLRAEDGVPQAFATQDEASPHISGEELTEP